MQVNHVQLEKKLHQVHLIISQSRWEELLLVKKDREKSYCTHSSLGLFVFGNSQTAALLVGREGINQCEHQKNTVFV